MENEWRRLDGGYPAVGAITNVDATLGTGTDAQGVAVQWQGELPMNTYQGSVFGGQPVPEGTLHSIVSEILADVKAIKAKLEA